MMPCEHKLHIATDLSLPLRAVTEALGFLGRRGSGKTYGAQKLAEEFHRAGAQFGVCKYAFDLRRVGEPVTIANVGVETVGRLLVTSGPTTAAQPILLQNVRYEADQLPPDGEMIVLRHAGPLVVLGGRYGGGNQPIPRIALRGTGHQYVEFVGRPLFGSFGAFSQSPVIAQNPAEAVVTGEYLAHAFRDSAENTVSVGRATVERI